MMKKEVSGFHHGRTGILHKRFTKLGWYRPGSWHIKQKNHIFWFARPNVVARFSKYDFWILWNFLDRYSKKYFRKIFFENIFSMKIFCRFDFFRKKIYSFENRKCLKNFTLCFNVPYKS